MSDRNQLKANFVALWPLSRLENLTLEEYTNQTKDSFCYWVEFGTQDLGGIRGGSSYKYGVYRRQNGTTKEKRRSYRQTNEYGWVAKLGDSPEVAFTVVKGNLLRVVKAAIAKDWDTVDRVPMAEAFKWKIAFLYSGQELLNIYLEKALQDIATSFGIENVKKMSIVELQMAIMAHKPKDEEYYAFSGRMWRRYTKQPLSGDAVFDAPTPSDAGEYVGPLNTILYGPPGTGKTYSTVIKAVEIADFDYYTANSGSRAALKTHFDKLLITDFEKVTGSIAFTTFHQAFGYEDFVEGIKPVSPIEGDQYLKYEVRPGIFKKMAELAKIHRNFKEDEVKAGVVIKDAEWGSAQFYKISLGNSQYPQDEEIFDYCMRNNVIAIGWGEDTDFTGMPETEIKAAVQQNNWDAHAGTVINCFTNYLKIGNYVIVSNGNSLARAIGKVVGEYEYMADSPIGYQHFRKVNWLVKSQDIPVDALYDRGFSQKTMYKLDKDGIKQAFFTNAKPIEVQPKPCGPKNFVLIIDEINRGNVSQIFGELITLIEEDKRAGRKECLEVILPYSQKPFTVPDNLYIIGTMNTADRSVEALDTALRRRFVFEEMSPQPDLLHPSVQIWNLWLDYSEVSREGLGWQEASQVTYEFLGVTDAFKNRQDAMFAAVNTMDEDEAIAYLISSTDETDFAGVRLDRILKRINRRIEILWDKDHCIGHSYFLGIVTLEALQEVFQSKIIPLLQEYFFGDIGKIGLVLGKGFLVDKSPSPASNELADFEYDGIDLLETKPIYHTVNVTSMETPTFLAALTALLKQ